MGRHDFVTDTTAPIMSLIEIMGEGGSVAIAAGENVVERQEAYDCLVNAARGRSVSETVMKHDLSVPLKDDFLLIQALLEEEDGQVDLFLVSSTTRRKGEPYRTVMGRLREGRYSAEVREELISVIVKAKTNMHFLEHIAYLDLFSRKQRSRIYNSIEPALEIENQKLFWDTIIAHHGSRGMDALPYSYKQKLARALFLEGSYSAVSDTLDR